VWEGGGNGEWREDLGQKRGLPFLSRRMKRERGRDTSHNQKLLGEEDDLEGFLYWGDELEKKN